MKPPPQYIAPPPMLPIISGWGVCVWGGGLMANNSKSMLCKCVKYVDTLELRRRKWLCSVPPEEGLFYFLHMC